MCPRLQTYMTVMTAQDFRKPLGNKAIDNDRVLQVFHGDFDWPQTLVEKGHMTARYDRMNGLRRRDNDRACNWQILSLGNG